MQQTSHDSAHEKYRQKHRRQRNRHGQNCESNFTRAAQRRFHHSFAHLHVPHDVFEHHDRVVHHEAHRKRQRHQRQIVDRVAQQIHNGEGADDGHRQRETGDYGGGEIPQKQKNYEDHQRNREIQREFHVGDGIAN